MAWYLNYYTCAHCGRGWTDEWSCMCDDDCPHCGARHMSPIESDDLTEIIAQFDDGYVVFQSPETAGHRAMYRKLASFRTLEEAGAYLRSH